MANVAKFLKSDVGALLKHNNRSFVNPLHDKTHINTDKSSENYNLCPNSTNGEYNYFNKRLKEVKILNRNDVNALCEWVVTCPKDLPDDKKDAFFKYTYEFIKDRYEERNIISAWVHKDEKTDHIHIDFIPVYKGVKKTQGVKTEIERVSAKKIINVEELNKFHPELKSYLEYKLGCPVHVLNEHTSEGNKTVKELKAESAEKAENYANDFIEKCNKLLIALNKAVDNKTSKKNEFALPPWNYGEKMFGRKDREKVVFNTKDFVDWYESKEWEFNNILRKLEDYKDSTEVLEDIKTELSEYSEIKEENERLKKELQKYNNFYNPDEYNKKNDELRKEKFYRKEAEKELKNMEKIKDKYKNIVNTIKKQYPKLINEIEKGKKSL